MALIYEKKNHIAYITLNRPEAHNAIDPETVIELVDAWQDFSEDKEIRCAILTGAGDQSFCAGADLGKLIPLWTGARKPETEADKKVQANPMLAQNALLRDFPMTKPVIAAINGNAIAGGFEILYNTDIRVAAENARFGLQEVKWSIVPAGGSTVHLTRQIPYARAMEILLTGELIDARQALAYGFVNQVVPRNKVMETAERYADTIAKNGPLAVAAVKQAVQENSGKDVKAALAREMELSIPVFLSRDAREGPRAFKEKREPIYKGK
ncbi:MAG: enoyl-CoA hydratase/isomerase family protein [Desulfosarcina sp.]|nr:enoyl-CoA hydratase/isomerase family protein [Desulfosarcina sp.]MBC2744351.1 enoyl-CoA hydratase/isomerase family protein [Desulfosarcina sp.]MBC2767260.1 crotonase/enoyl-CoA hydratase family protein [Desulfosarcina sp.]